MKKKLPQSLREKQEQERNATVMAVTNAILELTAQGYNIRIKDLIFVTGLSRSVFAKPHIRKILVEHGIVEVRETNPSETSGSIPRDIETLLAEKDGYIQRLLFENEQLKYEIELLRGRVHLLTHKASAKDAGWF